MKNIEVILRRLSRAIARHKLLCVGNTVFLDLIIMAWLLTARVQATNPAGKHSFTPFNRFGRMVHEYFVERVQYTLCLLM